MKALVAGCAALFVTAVVLGLVGLVLVAQQVNCHEYPGDPCPDGPLGEILLTAGLGVFSLAVVLAVVAIALRRRGEPGAPTR